MDRCWYDEDSLRNNFDNYVEIMLRAYRCVLHDDLPKEIVGRITLENKDLRQDRQELYELERKRNGELIEERRKILIRKIKRLGELYECLGIGEELEDILEEDE